MERHWISLVMLGISQAKISFGYETRGAPCNGTVQQRFVKHWKCTEVRWNRKAALWNRIELKSIGKDMTGLATIAWEKQCFDTVSQG